MERWRRAAAAAAAEVVVAVHIGLSHSIAFAWLRGDHLDNNGPQPGLRTHGATKCVLRVLSRPIPQIFSCCRLINLPQYFWVLLG